MALENSQKPRKQHIIWTPFRHWMGRCKHVYGMYGAYTVMYVQYIRYVRYAWYGMCSMYGYALYSITIQHAPYSAHRTVCTVRCAPYGLLSMYGMYGTHRTACIVRYMYRMIRTVSAVRYVPYGTHRAVCTVRTHRTASTVRYTLYGMYRTMCGMLPYVPWVEFQDSQNHMCFLKKSQYSSNKCKILSPRNCGRKLSKAAPIGLVSKSDHVFDRSCTDTLSTKSGNISQKKIPKYDEPL